MSIANDVAKKYRLRESTYFKHEDFVMDMTEVFDRILCSHIPNCCNLKIKTFEEYQDYCKDHEPQHTSISQFQAAIDQFRNIWEQIFVGTKVEGRMENLWKFFYATQVVTRRKELIPNYDAPIDINKGKERVDLWSLDSEKKNFVLDAIKNRTPWNEASEIFEKEFGEKMSPENFERIFLDIQKGIIKVFAEETD